MVHLYTAKLSSPESEWNNASDNSVDAQSDYHAKERKAKRKRQISQGITDRYLLEIDANVGYYAVETDSQTQKINF